MCLAVYHLRALQLESWEHVDVCEGKWCGREPYVTATTPAMVRTYGGKSSKCTAQAAWVRLLYPSKPTHLAAQVVIACRALLDVVGLLPVA